MSSYLTRFALVGTQMKMDPFGGWISAAGAVVELAARDREIRDLKADLAARDQWIDRLEIERRSCRCGVTDQSSPDFGPVGNPDGLPADLIDRATEAISSGIAGFWDDGPDPAFTPDEVAAAAVQVVEADIAPELVEHGRQREAARNADEWEARAKVLHAQIADLEAREKVAKQHGAAVEKARWEARIEAEAKERDLTRRSRTVDATRQAEGHATAVLRSLLDEIVEEALHAD